MKIALINPKLKIVNKNKRFKKFLTKYPNMYFYSLFWSGFSNGLLNIAALTPDDFEVKYFEENNEEIPFNEFFDIVGITATTQQATRAYRIARKFKEIWGDRVTVVIGGSHASFMPGEAGRFCDAVFIGEAENSWVSFLKDFRGGKRKSVYNAEDYDSVDLNKIPVPRYDLLKPEYYKMVWIQTSRGCPRNCEFCSATKFFGPKNRTKNLEQIIREIKAARNYLKYQQVIFSDDNMFINNERTIKFIERIKETNISYVIQSDISIGEDIDFLRKLKKSGCSIIFIGFESLEEKNLEMVNKNSWKLNQLKNYKLYINNIIQQGIGVYGAFIIGYDFDNKKTFGRLHNFITGNYLAGAQITFLTPLPGTDLRKRYENEGRIIENDWENYTFFDVNIKHGVLSKNQLEKRLLWLYKHIYSKKYLRKKNQYYKNVFNNMT